MVRSCIRAQEADEDGSARTDETEGKGSSTGFLDMEERDGREEGSVEGPARCSKEVDRAAAVTSLEQLEGGCSSAEEAGNALSTRVDEADFEATVEGLCEMERPKCLEQRGVQAFARSCHQMDRQAIISSLEHLAGGVCRNAKACT